MDESKEFNLRVIMLLSALESWSFSNETMIPGFLHEELSNVIENLRKKILSE